MAAKKQPKMERPAGVTILAILSVLFGLLIIAAGFGLAFILHSGYMTRYPSLSSHNYLFSLLVPVLIVLGFIYIILAYGLWTREKWGWYGSVVLSLIGIILDLFRILSNPARGIIGIVICLIIIIYLTRPRPRKYFGV